VSKFAISQLALPEILTVEDLNYLKCLKIIGLEILPARITNNWTQTDKYTIKKFSDFMTENEMQIPAFQGIFFNTLIHSIFDSYFFKDILNHIKLLCEIALLLNTKILILGAPSLRKINNINNYNESFLKMKILFREMAEICFSNGLKICIEACNKNYGNDFLINHLEVFNFIKDINHPGIGFHIDSATIFENKEKLESVLDYSLSLDHFHLSEPGLSGYIQTNINYFEYISNLNDVKYNHWVTFEFIFKDYLYSNKFPSEFIKRITDR